MKKGTSKLGKRAGFVKTQLCRLPQTADVWEADFQSFPARDHKGGRSQEWLGLVVSQTQRSVLAEEIVEKPPTIDDMARLLADAMQRPLLEEAAHRPQVIHLRKRPEWEALPSHLTAVGINVVRTGNLAVWQELAEDFLEDMGKPRRRAAKPVAEKVDIDGSFPVVTKWVREYGWIEIGAMHDEEFVVGAFDEGGVRFLHKTSRTLTQAMQALEKGIAKWFEENE